MIKDLPKVLKTKRKQLNIDANKLAQLLEIPVHNIYKWERGTKPSSLDFIKILESFLNGDYDICVENGAINTKKLLEKKINNNQSLVKSDSNIATLPPLIFETAIEAQKELIEFLKQENTRLKEENKKLKKD